MTPLDVLWRAGTFLLIIAYVVGSTWYIGVFTRQIYSRWSTWTTYPLPDKRAIKHIVGWLLLVAVDLLLLWFGLWWFSQ